MSFCAPDGTWLHSQRVSKIICSEHGVVVEVLASDYVEEQAVKQHARERHSR